MKLPPNAHDSLFTPAALQLGVIHWHLVKSDAMMTSSTIEEVSVDGSRFKKTRSTTFGKEVGQDEINWWIVKKETDLVELRAQSERALAAVEVLKARSRELRNERSRPEKYSEIVNRTNKFIESSATHIAVLHDFVAWLWMRDRLAPSILFTYRVWGSSKRGERMIDLSADSPEAEKTATIRELVEIVVGLRSRMGRTYERVWSDVAWDLAAAAEETGHSWEVPEDQVIQVTASNTFRECADYFVEIRDSLRNIILDIDKYNKQRDTLHDGEFWRRFIEKAVKSPSETALWDFKETLTMWHAKGDAKSQAKITFAEDVAGFARAAGGVLIVGVTDKLPRKYVGIGDSRDVENRQKACADVLAKYIEYDRNLVTFKVVSIADESTTKECLAVIVAQACEAVGVRGLDGRYSYPVRRETGISRESRLDYDGKYKKSDNHDFVADLVAFVDAK